jgi:DNA-binding response OmpR family regulator
MPAPDGFEVCRIIREDLPPDRQPYVTMITAAGQDADRQRAAQVGVDEFLTKPFSPSQLVARLRRLSTELRP